MADFLNLTETELISFAQNFAVKLAVHEPVLTRTALTGYNVEVGWNRGGQAGVRVRSQRAAEATWTEIGTDMTPPFVDNRAALVAGEPEERRYQAAYVDDDAVTTDWSATLTVIAHS